MLRVVQVPPLFADRSVCRGNCRAYRRDWAVMAAVIFLFGGFVAAGASDHSITSITARLDRVVHTGHLP